MKTDLKKRIVELVCISAALGVAFLLINFVHFQTLPVSVILYACVVDAFLASLLVGGVYWFFWRDRSKLLITEKALVFISSNLLILFYAVMGPTVIDRSLSIYIIEKIDYRGGEVAADAMKDIILIEFMDEYMVADVRMTEQVASGTVNNIDGCLKLTSRGNRIAAFTRFYRHNFLPQKRIIDGVVTNALTDPLSGKPVLVPFECASKKEDR